MKPSEPIHAPIKEINQPDQLIINRIASRAENFRQQLGDDKFNILFGDHSGKRSRDCLYYSDGNSNIIGFSEGFDKKEGNTTKSFGYTRFVHISQDGSILVQLVDNFPQGVNGEPGNVMNISATINDTGLFVETMVPSTFYESKATAKHPFVQIDKDVIDTIRERAPYHNHDAIFVNENFKPDSADGNQPPEKTLHFSGFTPEIDPERFVSINQENFQPLQFSIEPLNSDSVENN